jgi:hypothetical protein
MTWYGYSARLRFVSTAAATSVTTESLSRQSVETYLRCVSSPVEHNLCRAAETESAWVLQFQATVVLADNKHQRARHTLPRGDCTAFENG